MAKVKEEIVCENCEAEFRIEYNEGEHLSMCPFCGAGLDTDQWNEDDRWEDLESI